MDSALCRRDADRGFRADDVGPKAVAHSGGEQPGRADGRQNEVALLLLGGAEIDTGGQVDERMGLQLSVGDGLPHVGRLHPRGHVPVDATHVIARCVVAGFPQLRTVPRHQAPVVAMK